MISAIIPVYKETQQQIGDLIVHLSGFENISQIIITATDQDPDFSQIQSFIKTQHQQVKFAVASPAGRAIQMNSGAESSNQQNLLFLHCDTRLPDQADKLIIESLNQNQWGRFDLKFDDNRWIFQIIAWFINKRSRLTQISTGDQAIFVKWALFERLGGFPDQVLMEDIEFSKRAKQESEPAYINERVITSARRWQREGITKTVVLMWWLRLLYWLGASPDRLAKMYRQIR